MIAAIRLCVLHGDCLSFLVSLQPFEYDPAEKNKHKFMVLSTIAPDGDCNMDTVVSTDSFGESKIFKFLGCSGPI